MDNTTTVWIVVAVIAAVIAIAALAFVARNKRRHVQAERIREELDTHTTKLEKRQALADETAARARAAEAEAEAKAAEAARLKERAADHHEAVAASREDIDERRKHADHLDPKTRGTADDGQDGAEARTSEDTPARHEAERK